MTKEITKEAKTHAIVFWDKSYKLLTNKQYENIYMLSSQGLERFDLNRSLFNFKDISKMISLSEFYELYPDKRPVSYEMPKDQIDRTIYRSKNKKRTLKQLIKGLKRHINGVKFKGTNKPALLLKKMELKLNQMK